MNDKIKINLLIGETYYPLRVDPKEEEICRKAAKQVNMKLNAYRERYGSNLDTEKIMSMVAYQFAFEKLQLEDRNDTEPYNAKIKDYTRMLEEHLEGDK